MDTALLWLHVVGNIVWIGSILAVGVILSGTSTSPGPDPKVRGEIALGVYKRLAVPAFILSFLCGAGRLAGNFHFYLVEHHWMHLKLPLALGVIALHHVIGGRAKKMAAGTAKDAGPVGTLTAVLGALAIGATFVVIFRFPN